MVVVCKVGLRKIQCRPACAYKKQKSKNSADQTPLRISRNRHINQKGNHEKSVKQSQPIGKLVSYPVIHVVSISAKFDTCPVGGLNGTLVEDKIRTFLGDCDDFSFIHKCPIWTHDSTSAKFSTN